MTKESPLVFLFLSRSRAFVIGVLVSMLASATVAAFIYQRERTVLIGREGIRLTNMAQMVVTSIDRRLEAWVQDVEAFAEFGPFQREQLDVVAVRETLEVLQRRGRNFSWLGLTDTEGRVLAATGGMLEGQIVRERPWFAEGLRGPHLGDVHPAVLLGRLLPPEEGGQNAYFLDASAPIRRSDGQVVGVLAGHMNWQWILNYRNEIFSAAPRGDSLDIVIADPAGFVLFSGNTGNSPPRQFSLTLPPPPIGRVAAWTVHDPEDGPAVVVAAIRGVGPNDRGLGWSIHVQRRVADVVAPANELLRWLTLGCALIAMVGGLIAALASNMVSRAVRGLAGQGARASTEESVALVRRRLADLQSAAHRDRLTGLLNRAGFDAWRQAYPLPEDTAQLVVLDLNGFKPINDTYGHAVGDEVLVALGAWLKERVRAGDAAVRLGGDEFVICLPRAPRVVADRFVSQLRDFLAGGVATSAGALPLGCSVGVIAVSAVGRSMDEALIAADGAMYQEKRQAGVVAIV